MVFKPAAFTFTPRITHYIEAVKAWAGHTEPAAGALGLTTLAAQLVARTLAGQCHLRALNPHVAEAVAKVKVVLHLFDMCPISISQKKSTT